MTELFAHIAQAESSNVEQRTQSLEAHSRNVGELASLFAAEFGCGDIARVMGLLHDKGKEQADWQKYIQGVTGYNRKYVHVKSGPHHAYVGAVIAQKLYPQIAPLIAQPIAGHHRGLYDYCDYTVETKHDIPNDVTIDNKTPFTFPKFLKLEKYDYHHLVRMFFSCLVDADSLDTESFMNPEQAKFRGSHTTMEELLGRMESYLRELRNGAKDTEVNRIRNYVQEQCVKESQGETGFYSLTVPTGGGKTLASVLWALHHAVNNYLQRIIIAIPYTSIIVQTAATLKSIFGEENVLEHHSNVSYESDCDKNENDEDELALQLKLATENWDYPIIVTTNVQFFESLFNNRRSDCRKLHNIVKSVVILDEVQTLPLGFYKPIVHTLDTLRRVFGTSFLFTTASQPILSGRIEGSNPKAGFDALANVHEIIPANARLHDKLRRVKLEFMEGAKSYDEIANAVSKHNRILCIVNTRKDAKEIFERLPDEGIRLHLSRMMCPAHVSATIQHIKQALENEDNEPIRVVATQLIEAGVDIDFPVVFRQEAGLDSILQAAGRCNREGKYPKLCNTYIFRIEGSSLPSFVSNCCEALNKVVEYYYSRERKIDFFNVETMREYFKKLQRQRPSFDNKLIEEKAKEQRYETVAGLFHLIEQNQKLIIVDWEDSIELADSMLKDAKKINYITMRKLLQYCVSITQKGFEIIYSTGDLEPFIDNIYIIRGNRYYDKKTGLVNTNPWLEELLIIEDRIK